MPHNSQPPTSGPPVTPSRSEEYQTNPILLLTHCYKTAYNDPNEPVFHPKMPPAGLQSVLVPAPRKPPWHRIVRQPRRLLPAAFTPFLHPLTPRPHPLTGQS
jgi:hypothetical protein